LRQAVKKSFHGKILEKFLERSILLASPIQQSLPN